ncbi:MAG: hypothetical protein RI935_444 [Candidatus Parcubacteria bacterium]|jgi:hypothetical protein
MNLSTVEQSLDELMSRHKELTIETLRTILTASLWDEKHIKEAELLFKGRQSVIANGVPTTPQTSLQEQGINEPKVETQIPLTDPSLEVPSTTITESAQPDTVVKIEESSVTPDVTSANIVASKGEEKISFIRADGEEEGDLSNIVTDVAELPKIKKEEINISSNNNTSESIKEIGEQKEIQSEVKSNLMSLENTNNREERTSLVETKDIPSIKKEVAIPEDLPLLPFESSPHVWSFAKYKSTFHKEHSPEQIKEMEDTTLVTNKTHEVIREDTKQESVDAHFKEEVMLTEKKGTSLFTITPAPTPVTTVTTPVIDTYVATSNNPSNQAVPEDETPSKVDHSMSVLASVMLFVILLLLGYMYSLGRL